MNRSRALDSGHKPTPAMTKKYKEWYDEQFETNISLEEACERYAHLMELLWLLRWDEWYTTKKQAVAKGWTETEDGEWEPPASTPPHV